MATNTNHPQVVFIGIGCPSGCGKTTYGRHLVNRLRSPLHLIELDHFFNRGISIDHPILGRIERFLLFALSNDLTNMFDIRIFFESTLSECRMKRYRRHSRISDKVSDEQIRVPNKFQQWFDHLVWNEYLKRRNLQISRAEKIFQFDDYKNRQYMQIDDYIDKRLQELTD
ncbi:unnamed protein product [Rotaria magnacalcarata]|uniref:Uncharacterized protein n=2 Tax=Rotaria magnacalcarata TaxID=392030 RepID=A0A816H5P7_9BILA|nr:unnamed protein product [Rotaria magnacalcarata]